MLTIHYQDMDSPLGTIRLAASETALLGCYFTGQKYFPAAEANWEKAESSPVIESAKAWLTCYFQQQSLPPLPEFDPQGTDFQRLVWNALGRIPLGNTTTYGELAANLGRPEAVRAVAAAIGRNPISVMIPCHRVLGKNGSLTGYAGGLDRKAALLKLENAH